LIFAVRGVSLFIEFAPAPLNLACAPRRLTSVVPTQERRLFFSLRDSGLIVA
jgi:hypothetical protein